jgi:cellulose biosynthesis protein BcsQ
MRSIAFFNNKGGVGKTSLVYHLAWMFAELGLSVLAADLDPQANLTSMFLEEERMAELWSEKSHRLDVYGSIQPLLEGTGDVAPPHIEAISEELGLLAGSLALSGSEEELSAQWPLCLDRKPRAFRVLSAFWRVLEAAAAERRAQVVLVDVGPNLGAINRAALLACHSVVIPLAPDLYSLQGLRNLGPALRRWRSEWTDRRGRNPEQSLSIPTGDMQPAGYIVMQHAVRLDRPVQAYERWMRRIPSDYREHVLDEPGDFSLEIARDPHCLAQLKHYRSLMPLAQEAHKPMFKLTAADGAIGGHGQAAKECYQDFRKVAREVASRCGVPLP